MQVCLCERNVQHMRLCCRSQHFLQRPVTYSSCCLTLCTWSLPSLLPHVAPQLSSGAFCDVETMQSAQDGGSPGSDHSDQRHILPIGVRATASCGSRTLAPLNRSQCMLQHSYYRRTDGALSVCFSPTCYLGFPETHTCCQN